MQEYHSTLSGWMCAYFEFLFKDIRDEDLWKRSPHCNSPGWTIMHLTAEGELAIAKILPGAEVPDDAGDFLYGSDGNATATYTKEEMLKRFGNTYKRLGAAVVENMESLKSAPLRDESLEGLLNNELDFNLHMLTTHIAMHCQSLIIWKKESGYA